MVLNTKKVKDIVEANNVTTLVADYTNRDPEIAKFLKQLKADKAGLPVLAVFPANSPDNPIVVTGVYTQAQLIKILEKAGPSAAQMTSKQEKGTSGALESGTGASRVAELNP